ncbi:hypothetical protein [Nodosilinea sp. FACHB-13]|uniref:hypothetical protein n=1 Tax=Cyanophyceae TaxID=3028117 RepID=UPI0016895AA4|nr:hypothetical protein [Nodosilinea sp. FACHB-13]MBD2107425.1 hypothetical protein [Nodosilinea sp. FACHB-13]
MAKEVRTVQIIKTFRTGMPYLTDLYQPGTIPTAEFTGGRWAGKIIQLQILTNSLAINGLTLSIEDEDGTEYGLLDNVRVRKQESPVDLMPLLGYESGFYMGADHVLKATVVYPQNFQPEYFITIMGFAIETKDDESISDLVIDGGLYDGA